MNKDNPLHNQAVATSSPAAKTYENNPFFVATNGLELLFQKAQSVGIAFAIIAGLSFLASIPSYFITPNDSDFQDSSSASQASPSTSPTPEVPVEFWAIFGIILLIAAVIGFFIGLVIRGTADYAAAQLAQGKTVTLGEALRGVFAHFWGYAWAMVVMHVKLLLWFMLLIVPGFVMSIRYSLTGVMYFDKQLKGGSASKNSAALTKGAWLTTYASHTLLNMITFSAIQPLLIPGTNAILYRQLQAVGDNKPKAHALSWLTLFIPFILLGLFILLMVSLFMLIMNSSTS